MAAGITDRRGVDARHLPELALGAPETAQTELDFFQLGGKWRLQRMAIHEVAVVNLHGLGAAGQGLFRQR